MVINACSNTERNIPQNTQQDKEKQAVIPEVTKPEIHIVQPITPKLEVIEPIKVQPAISPINFNITSLSELTNIFNRLKYDRKNCTENNCEIPPITFNKVSKNWKSVSRELPVTIKKELFFRLMTPLILIANEKIEVEKEIIENSEINSPALKKIALKYRIIKHANSPFNETLRKKLLQNVDIIPPSLALAQAAEESGWATSRFAIEGNAFFGQWDYSGKGMKPLRQRTDLGNYRVARFDTPLASVDGYMLNINCNKAYQKFRDLRSQLRAKNKPLTGEALSVTLDKYSERGIAYTKSLRTIINYNKLQPIDFASLKEEQPIRIIVN